MPGQTVRAARLMTINTCALKNLSLGGVLN